MLLRIIINLEGMVIYVLLIVFFIAIFTMLLCCLTCMSLFGVTSYAKNLIMKYSSRPYDRQLHANGPHQPLNTDCYICLERVKLEVVATCNHSFCGECIASYIDSKPNQPIDCPACRKQVCVLFRRFQPANAAEKRLKQRISQYNFAYSQEPSFIRSLLEIGTFIREIPRLLTPEGIVYMLSNPRIKTMLLMLIYTLSPVDLLPEALLGPVGLLDDSVVAVGLLNQVSALVVNFVRQEAARDRQPQ